VMTRGGYDNPNITEPLENYSQINCALPVNEEPPCVPIIAEFTDPCLDQKNCIETNFVNTIRWSLPDESCEADIRSYNIYVSASSDGNYTLLANVLKGENIYEDKNLASLARCYRITAVNRAGVESGFSEPQCNDNCPQYVLPNVFTPGDGNNCNELFSAYGVELNLGETPKCPPADVSNELCARFVQRVVFSVYNRWGKKVYDYTGQLGDPNHSIYLNWDGRDNQGNDLTTGIYYYLAEVTYDVGNPAKRFDKIKGWVHIIRPGSVRPSN
jgi:hypothetical protein